MIPNKTLGELIVYKSFGGRVGGGGVMGRFHKCFKYRILFLLISIYFFINNLDSIAILQTHISSGIDEVSGASANQEHNWIQKISILIFL